MHYMYIVMCMSTMSGKHVRIHRIVTLCPECSISNVVCSQAVRMRTFLLLIASLLCSLPLFLLLKELHLFQETFVLNLKDHQNQQGSVLDRILK